MKKIFYRSILAITFAAITTTAQANLGHFGITLPVILAGKDPNHTHAIRAIAWYEPLNWHWQYFDVYIAANAGHWWSAGASHHRSLNIYAVAPVLRFSPVKFPKFTPYLEASIGPAYLTKTKIDDRNLGMHFSFQDEIAVGATYGPEQRLSTSISVLHYSNGRMSSYNAGITVYALLNVGYRFN